LTRNGFSAREIAQTLGRSERWVCKWRKRAGSGTPDWYRDGSHAPHRPSHKADPDWEEQVVTARKRLATRREAKGHAFIGSIAIRKELEEQGAGVEGHSLRQIERILKRHDLVAPRKRRQRGGPKRFYPGPHNHAEQPWDLHELDFVGPLYLHGGHRFSVLSRVDIVSGDARSWVKPRQTTDQVQTALWQDWQSEGMPTYLQMDNQLPFIGGRVHARTLSHVVRLCLFVGIQPVFIPFYCSFYNAHVESYQGLWQAEVFERFTFATPDEFVAEMQRFRDAFASYRAYERTVHQRPNRHHGTRRLLPADLQQPSTAALSFGHIHFIRRVSDEGRIEILNEVFRVPREFANDYLWASIDTQSQTLTVHHHANNEKPVLVLQANYAFRETASQPPIIQGG
jgi:transposase